MSARKIYLAIIVAVVVIAAVATALLMPGVFGGAQAQTITLVMRDRKFNATNPTFTVQKGVPVKITLISNEVVYAHNFVIPEIPGVSIPINPSGNRELTVTFPTAGTYHYLCSLHPALMNGTITVTG